MRTLASLLSAVATTDANDAAGFLAFCILSAAFVVLAVLFRIGLAFVGAARSVASCYTYTPPVAYRLPDAILCPVAVRLPDYDELASSAPTVVAPSADSAPFVVSFGEGAPLPTVVLPCPADRYPSAPKQSAAPTAAVLPRTSGYDNLNAKYGAPDTFVADEQGLPLAPCRYEAPADAAVFSAPLQFAAPLPTVAYRADRRTELPLAVPYSPASPTVLPSGLPFVQFGASVLPAVAPAPTDRETVTVAACSPVAPQTAPFATPTVPTDTDLLRAEQERAEAFLECLETMRPADLLQYAREHNIAVRSWHTRTQILAAVSATVRS